MLVHLDGNNLCLHATKENELYQLMLGIAAHTLGIRADPRRPDRPLSRRSADEEVQAIKTWLSRRATKVTRGERPMTYRQLRHVLARFRISLENPHSNSIDVVRDEVIRSGLLRKQKNVRSRLGTIGYRDEGTEVSIKDVKNVRKMCECTEEDGVDSEAFYGDAEVIDACVNRYRTVLRRLAKT